MPSQTTDNDALPHRRPNPPPLTGNAEVLQPAPDASTHPWIIDATLMPVHDQSITAISKTFSAASTPRSSSARTVAALSPPPASAGPVTATTSSPPRATVGHLLGDHEILGDGGYRAITSINSPHRDKAACIIRDNTYRTHRKIRARLDHDIATITDWQILRQCRRHGDATNHNPQIVTGH